MSIKVRPAELKLAAKVANQVRDISGGGSNKRYPWLNHYRLVADPSSGLALYATDGSSWLTWIIPTEEPFEDVYDIVLPSSKLNDFLSKMDDGLAFEITKEDGQITLTRGVTIWRIPEEDPIPYPKTPAGGQLYETFSVSAATLVKNFKFAEPFINSASATSSNTVATWLKDGLLATGAQRHLIRVEGMPCPPVHVNFKQKPLNSVISFLSALQEDVNTTISGRNYTFQCPTSGSKFTVLGETAIFPSEVKLGSQEPTVIKFDGKTLLKGVSTMNTLLPAEADRILVRITGSKEDSFIYITTLTTDSKKSQEGFPIIRETDGDQDIQFVVNCRIFEISLGQMGGDILEGRFYESAVPPRFLIEDERATDDDTYRCVLVPVTLSVMDLENDDEPKEPKKAGAKKPEKKVQLSKP
jgi:DNA polymerase III sliding clamp (beta) subunit (PCNA family)